MVTLDGDIQLVALTEKEEGSSESAVSPYCYFFSPSIGQEHRTLSLPLCNYIPAGKYWVRMPIASWSHHLWSPAA